MAKQKLNVNFGNRSESVSWSGIVQHQEAANATSMSDDNDNVNDDDDGGNDGDDDDGYNGFDGGISAK